MLKKILRETLDKPVESNEKAFVSDSNQSSSHDDISTTHFGSTDQLQLKITVESLTYFVGMNRIRKQTNQVT